MLPPGDLSPHYTDCRPTTSVLSVEGAPGGKKIGARFHHRGPRWRTTGPNSTRKKTRWPLLRANPTSFTSNLINSVQFKSINSNYFRVYYGNRLKKKKKWLPTDTLSPGVTRLVEKQNGRNHTCRPPRQKELTFLSLITQS